MGEPWLDSLSEDWNSEPKLSSPAASIHSKSNTSRRVSSTQITQSRIPHLVHNIRQTSTSAFLKPRSSRGIAKQRESSVLADRTAESLNQQLLSSPISTKSPNSRKPSTSTIPRRASSSLSESQNSVQHHTVHKSSNLNSTPDWKRRLVAGDAATSDGLDLFSPSKLEGMFKSTDPIEEDENIPPTQVSASARPWNTLSSGSFPAPAQQHGSQRRPRSRAAPEMDILEEVDEDNENDTYDMSAISSDVIRQSAIKGMVHRRVSNLEMQKMAQDARRPSNDPRYRTLSGRQELGNEVISPVTASKQNTIRENAIQASLDADPESLRRRLEQEKAATDERPSSKSSNRDVPAPDLDLDEQSKLHGDFLADMTSQSLPEDLSMGTQQYNTSYSFVNNRRGGAFGEASFLRKKLSSSAEDSQFDMQQRDFRSSPPPYQGTGRNIDSSRLSVTEPTSPADTSVVHHPTSGHPSTSGSPLKLFGNRDTYTTNKLMRVLSQFEHGSSEPDLEIRDETSKMSQFGGGQLNGFGFHKQVERPAVIEQTASDERDKIFRPTDAEPHSDGTVNRRASGSARPPPELSHARQDSVSTTKEPSPKRRRTLVRDEITFDPTGLPVKPEDQTEASMAGRKRKDARPGKDMTPASPGTLASRSLLHPKLGSRKSSLNSHSRVASASEELNHVLDSQALSDALASDPESFMDGMMQAQQTSRKPSYATKDYMEEANKVMELIRARGKPKPMPQLADIEEPEDESELNADHILDMTLDESTKDSFERPPSRDRPVKARTDPRISHHNSRVASHLRKFADNEDLDILTSTSAFGLGTMLLADNKAVDEAAAVPIPDDESAESMSEEQGHHESSPAGIRILNEHAENDKKRKHSGTTASEPNMSCQGTQNDLTKRTIASNSSTSSGQRGMITSGTVSIPDTVGTMTFDHDKQIWVRRQLQQKRASILASSPARSARQEYSEADPFEGIRDLSIDETQEARFRKQPVHHEAAITAEPKQPPRSPASVRVSQQQCSIVPGKSSLKSPRRRMADNDRRPGSQDSKHSEHEQRLHEGLPSVEPNGVPKQQPRVVTIAFSSPIASEIPYRKPASMTDTDLDSDDPSLLPLDDDGSVLANDPVKDHRDSEDEDNEFDSEAEQPHEFEQEQKSFKAVMGSVERHEQYRAMTLTKRQFSRIEENDENQDSAQELSMVHIKQQDLTPLPARHVTRFSAKKESSILCLTPLSEFTLHQVDKLNHPEESFVGERVNPKTLRQAHGSHALVKDALIKAITDEEPTELFWEQLRKLSLNGHGLTGLHGLTEYCSSLESLSVQDNKITQLNDVPLSLMVLNIASNMINDLSSWNHLHNLQVVDVSNNSLESLECFSSLVHLRKLSVRNNKVRRLDGILDLTGLISLDASENDIAEVDFASCELTSMEYLALRSNRMMHAKGLEYLPNLMSADVSDNLLEEFVVSKGRTLSCLKTLDLSRNELDTLDLSILPCVQNLNLDDNCLTAIAHLDTSPSLRSLSMRAQRTSTDIVNHVLTTSTECLAELYLSSNSIPSNTLTLPTLPQYNLRCLEISACGIRHLPSNFGDFFPNTRVLNLNFNAVSELQPLLGMVRLHTLYVAKNRIQKMRRTCLALSRLQGLRKVDLRDNPLTVGFYPPTAQASDPQEPNELVLGMYRLPARNVGNDMKWVAGLLDETTWLRRKAMEMLLAQGCEGLEELDGARFEREGVLSEGEGMRRLMGKGVLRRGMLRDNVEQEVKGGDTGEEEGAEGTVVH